MVLTIKECAKRIQSQGFVIKPSSNQNIVSHSHKWFELVYIIKGQTECRLNGHSIIVREGNYFIIDYAKPHEYHRISDDHFQMVNIMFSPRFIDPSLIAADRFNDILQHYLLHFHKSNLNLSPTHTIYNDTDDSIMGYINSMQTEYYAQKAGYMETLRCFLLLILLQMMRNISSADTTRKDESFSYAIAEYVRNHYCEHIKIENALPDLAYSLPYISKRFKKDMGMTFSEYLKKVRIEESCRLLINTQKSIAEIAELVGYSDTTFYYKIFKDFILMSPHEYRKMYTQN